jgi:hypothetical protein
VEGETGAAPTVISISYHYPIIKNLVGQSLGEAGAFSDIFLIGRYALSNMTPEVKGPDSTSMEDLPLVLDNYYHAIKSDGSRTVVTLKSTGGF